MVLAIVAGALGLDPAEGLGPNRRAILGVGAACLFTVFAFGLATRLDERRMKGIRSRDRRTPSKARAFGDVGEADPGTAESGPGSHASPDEVSAIVRRPGRATGSALGLAAFILLMQPVYWWYATAGRFDTWTPTSRYYDLLADGFLAGQAALPIRPRPELANMSNVYRQAARGQGIQKIRYGQDPRLDALLLEREAGSDGTAVPVILDASYFEGRYYLYFGPAPAVLLALIKAFAPVVVSDGTLAIVGISGVALLSALVLLRLKDLHFPGLPRWMWVVSLGSIGVLHPLAFVLGRAAIWEAAVALGQGFFLGGVFVALPGLSGRRLSRAELVGCSLLFGLAIATRASLAGAVAAIAAALMVGLWSEMRGRATLGAILGRAAWFLAPLGIALAGFAFYNSYRFGSPLETGLQYQLTGTDMADFFSRRLVFNERYLGPNLLYYTLAMPQKVDQFPLLRPSRELSDMPGWWTFPRTIEIESIAGVLFTTPIALLAPLLLAEVLCPWSLMKPAGQRAPHEHVRDSRGFRRLIAALALACACAAAPLLFYFTVSDRFALDWSPLLAIISIAGAWFFYTGSRDHPLRRGMLSVSVLGLFLIGWVVTLLLAVTGPESVFDDRNPELFRFLVDLFRRS